MELTLGRVVVNWSENRGGAVPFGSAPTERWECRSSLRPAMRSSTSCTHFRPAKPHENPCRVQYGSALLSAPERD